MDVHLQGNSQLHYRVNGGARPNSRLGLKEDNTLQYLSPAEKECLQFFEETIESLEESLEVDNRRPRAGRTAVNHVDGLPVLSSNHRVNVSSHQDIIDLVRQEPAVQNQEPTFNPSSPDFQHMFPTPESHFEVKPIRDSLPSGYDPSLPSGSYGSADGHSSYHPPGCIPTPVLIAQKIAENKGEGTTNLDPSTILRRLSSEKSSNRPNVHVTHSPHSPAKPRRYPANINVIHSSKEPKPVANVDIHERQEQMLSNLPGSSYPLVLDNSLQVTDQTERNVPARRISFNDPEPDKSRMEALSKLGLNKNKAAAQDHPKDPDTRAKTTEPSMAPAAQSPNAVPPPSYFYSERKPEPLSPKSFQEKPSSPTAGLHSPPPTDVTKLEFNNYGGKSVIVNAVPSKNEPLTHPTSPEPKTLPPAMSNPTELNPYGGKTKVMTAAAAPATKTNLPDILSSHMDKNQPTAAKLEPQLAELNSYGGKSRSINPTNRSTSKSAKPPPPATAPRPPRSSYQGINAPPKSSPRALSPDHKRKPSSMFRPQGITVQFCGRGAMNESRREALRKLGLLKDS